MDVEGRLLNQQLRAQTQAVQQVRESEQAQLQERQH